MKLQIPPPVLAFTSGLLMWAIGNYVSFGHFEIDMTWRKSIFLVFVILGVAVSFAAFFGFKSAKTTLDPMNPSKASVLVTEGIYQWTRNPMYLGLLLILIAWAVYLQSWLTLAIIAMFYVYMTNVQIKGEEAALKEKFGETYEAYTAQVRRWL